MAGLFRYFCGLNIRIQRLFLVDLIKASYEEAGGIKFVSFYQMYRVIIWIYTIFISRLGK